MTKKQEICDKALALFCERGYDNTPMSHIAKAIDASKAILYHYFPNKEELLFSIIDHQMEMYLTPLLEDAYRIAAPDERLRYFLKNYTQLLASGANSRIVLHEAHRLSPEHFNVIRARHQKVYRIIYDAISEMEAQGKIAASEKAFYAFAAIGMCTWTFYWFDQSRKESVDRLADTFTDIFFNGILNAKGRSE